MATPPRRRSSLLGGDGELTPSGVQVVHAGLRRSGRAIALQVLGVFRYVADPALRSVLPRRAAKALGRDVFDLLVSDGQMKMKVLLSPALNHLIWRGLVNELDVIELDDYELVSVSDSDDSLKRSVCIIHELTPRATTVRSNGSSAAASNSTPRKKIVYSVGSALLTSPVVPSASAGAVPDLQFVSDAHIRDHGALPLAGKRLYYLSLFSDDYPADWEPVQTEPLTPVSDVIPWTEWNRRRRYCNDMFTSDDRIIHTIREVNVLTGKRKHGDSDSIQDVSSANALMNPPPIIGIVNFKSGLVHLGVPDVPNEFAFMFHIVLMDHSRYIEIAFFGSSAAKNFLTIQEGDVIQLQGYTVTNGPPRNDDKTSQKIFVYSHLSVGVVSHVPDKYWCMLETTGVLPNRPYHSIVSRDKGDLQFASSSGSTVWQEPIFLTTLHSRHGDVLRGGEWKSTYFDVAGVVSFIGRLHRHRSHEDGMASVTSYRWIKVIDDTSSSEMIVRLHVNSQPAAFHAIQAGDVVLLSRLHWVDAPSGQNQLKFATTSFFSTLRLNDEVEPYYIFRECLDVYNLAKSVLGDGETKVQYSAVDSRVVGTTESWLDGSHMENYEPDRHFFSMEDAVAQSLLLLNEQDVATSDNPSTHWIPEFNPQLSVPMTQLTVGIGYNYPFDEVASICESMDALTHRYLRVHVALHDIRVGSSSFDNGVPEVELLVTDGELQNNIPQPIRVSANVLMKDAELPSPLAEAIAPEAEVLARLLTPRAIKSLNTASILRSTELPQFSPAKPSTSNSTADAEFDNRPVITLDIVKEYIFKNRQGMDGGRIGGIDIALHIYRMPHGELDLWVDGISL